MASNPMLQAVLLFQNHQTTTPFLPVRDVAVARALTADMPQEKIPAPGASSVDMAKPKEEKEPKEEEENGEENGENEEEQEQEGEQSSA